MKYQIKQLFSQNEIDIRVSKLAEEISRDYINQEVLLVGLLRGSVIFLADVARKINCETQIDFMTVSSYGNSMESNRDVRILKDLEEAVFGKNVIIIEDIIDTGYTLSKVIEVLQSRQPKSLKICTLLDKPSRREVSVKSDYVGFAIDDLFVVGYGIDYAQKHRTLPYVGYVEFVGEDHE